MRTLLALVLLTAASALAQAPPAAPVQSQTAIPQEQENTRKAREIIQKMITALGGDAFLNYKDMSQIGRTYTFYQGQPRGVGAKFWRFWMPQTRERFEFTDERDVIYVYNGDKGYETTFRGTRPMEPKDISDYLLRREHSTEQVLRIWLKDPATMLFYEGKSVAERHEVEKVSILNPEYKGVTFFVDSKSFLPIRKTFTVRDPQYKEKVEYAETYDNYQPEQGIQTARTVTREENGLPVSQRFIIETKYNVGLADSLFDAQATPPPPTKNQPKKKR